MDQLTKEQALAIYNGGEWKNWTDDEIVRYQLFQDRLAVPFTEFLRAITAVFGRPVYTHEFAFREQLIKEYLGEKEPPTFEDIINLIPAEKRIIIGV